MKRYTKQEARTEIANLVKNFRKNQVSLQDAPEAQIENDYIRPLFRFLNWNVDNIGLSESQREFVLQKTDRAKKRPDYVLQLDGHQLIVMDAKRTKYSMHDPRWVNQVYAYAYSTQNYGLPRKIDFALLTDFEEFVVLDCTLYAAKPEVINNFRVLDWTCDDFVSQFETLWELFERGNMLAANKTRHSDSLQGLWALYLSPEKVKANRIPPDEAFLAQMDADRNGTEGWRMRLARDMKKFNPEADGELITAAVQLLINRLIFIKTLSDRDIEDDYLAEIAQVVERDGLAEDDRGWLNACRSIFSKLNTIYNGSVFEPRPELESVSVSNKVVRSVIQDLLPENSPYNFAVLPVEILGTIYERFLGRVVRTTDHRVKIEDKQTRKERGVYYTPQHIVDYIVSSTLGDSLSKCKSSDDVAKIKVLDPACGSGSFLLGAYATLIEWHKAYYGSKKRLSSEDRKSAYIDDNDSVRLTATLKRQILINNIFGVDIDSQAVEVTRFSLSLKALEETRHDELYEERTLFKQTVLPDLSQNIKCGNSLIANDYSMYPPERAEVNAFEWNDQFTEVMQKGGFDVVIGNPPYIDSEWLVRTNPKLRKYCVGRYESAKGNWDIFCVFIEKALSLCRASGWSGFIVPNKIFSADYARGLRRWLAENHVFVSVRDYSSVAVFPVSVYPIVYIAHSGNAGGAKVKVEKMVEGNGLPKIQDRTEVKWSELKSLGGESWSQLLGASDGVAEKMNRVGKPLEQVATVGGAATVSEAYQYKNLIVELKSNIKNYSPVVNTGTINRYEILWGHSSMRYLGGSFVKPVIPKSAMNELSGKRQKETRSTKIIVAGMTKRLECVYDSGEYVAAKSTSVIISDSIDLFYLLGILNSKLMTYYYRQVFSGLSLQGGFFRVGPPQLKRLPVCYDESRKDQLIVLVKNMMDLREYLAEANIQSPIETYQRQIAETEKQIDGIVFQIYQLTDKEKGIVEKSVE